MHKISISCKIHELHNLALHIYKEKKRDKMFVQRAKNKKKKLDKTMINDTDGLPVLGLKTQQKD